MPALKNTQELPLQYQRLRQKLAHIGWIALGSLVQRVKPGQGGPRYQWSRRIGPKTVTVALSAEQFDWLKEAIRNQRQVWDILMELQQLTAQHWKSSQGPLDASASAKNAWALTNGHSDLPRMAVRFPVLLLGNLPVLRFRAFVLSCFPGQVTNLLTSEPRR